MSIPLSRGTEIDRARALNVMQSKGSLQIAREMSKGPMGCLLIPSDNRAAAEAVDFEGEG